MDKELNRVESTKQTKSFSIVKSYLHQPLVVFCCCWMLINHMTKIKLITNFIKTTSLRFKPLSYHLGLSGNHHRYAKYIQGQDRSDCSRNFWFVQTCLDETQVCALRSGSLLLFRWQTHAHDLVKEGSRWHITLVQTLSILGKLWFENTELSYHPTVHG
jgi:hypothetical protein